VYTFHINTLLFIRYDTVNLSDISAGPKYTFMFNQNNSVLYTFTMNEFIKINRLKW